MDTHRPKVLVSSRQAVMQVCYVRQDAFIRVAGSSDTEASEIMPNYVSGKPTAGATKRKVDKTAGSDDDDGDWDTSDEKQSGSDSDSELSDLESKDMEALRRYFLK